MSDDAALISERDLRTFATADAVAFECLRRGALLKEERIKRQLAELGMAAAEALAAGYTQVTRWECCHGLGVQTMMATDQATGDRSMLVRLCPCFGLERATTDDELIAAMRRVPPPGWPT